MAEFLIRFADGPLASRHNISTVAGSSGNVVVQQDLFGWPLPKRLGVLTHEGVANVAFWDEDDPDASGLPEEITQSPNALVYKKVSQRELPEDVPNVVRGAEYELED